MTATLSYSALGDPLRWRRVQEAPHDAPAFDPMHPELLDAIDPIRAGTDHGSQLSLVGRAIPHAVISARLNAGAVDAAGG